MKKNLCNLAGELTILSFKNDEKKRNDTSKATLPDKFILTT